MCSSSSVVELGHEAALWDLGCCVGERNELAIDWTKAVPLYQHYAAMGHPIALKNLGTCYYRY